jgi:carbon storage regulator
MLVLSRKENERIRLGDSIVVTVIRLAGDKVRLGIQAPPHVLVLRDELEPFVAGAAPTAIDISIPLAQPSVA